METNTPESPGPTAAAGDGVSRRTFLGSAGLGLALANLVSRALPGERSGGIAEAAATMNILLISIDTLRHDHLGVTGDPVVQTPNLDALARRGVLMPATYVTEPSTNASHASMLTGALPNVTGVRSQFIDKVAARVPTLAEILRQGGFLGQTPFRTGAVYSWVSLDPVFSGLDRGFDRYEGYVVGAADGRPLRTTDRAFDPRADLEAQIDGRANVTTDASLAMIESMQGQPFFIWTHYFDPHLPFTPPAPYDTRYDPGYTGPVDGSLPTIHRIQGGALPLDPAGPDTAHLDALYRGEISYVDEQIGRIVDRLTSLGIAERTAMVVVGDHGESFGEHGTWFHPTSLYNQEIRVPMIMVLPGLPATRIATAVSTLDIAPTILELLGIDPPPTFAGQSILPLLGGRSTGADRIVFSQSPDDRLYAAIGNEWKLILRSQDGTHELFHLPTDPAEFRNLAAEAVADPAIAAQRDRLYSALAAWLGQQGGALLPLR